MIFFGTRASSIRKGQIMNVECPNCKAIATMRYSIFARYFHLYWIPTFPTKKLSVAECNSCKQTFGYVDVELANSIRRKIEQEKEKNTLRYPIWMYSGTFLILTLFCYGFYDMHQTDLNNADYIKDPKVGDVYYMKLPNDHYTTLRVDKATRTEVYITSNDYEIDLESDISTIDETKNYTKLKDTINVIRLQGLFKDETITEIVRN